VRIRTFSTANEQATLPPLVWDTAYHGHPLDVRGDAAIEFVNAVAGTTMSCEYDIKEARVLLLNGTKARTRDIAARFVPEKTVLLEATTLGLVELLILLRAAERQCLNSVDLLYVEPKEYKRDVSLDAPWTREFTLSSSRRFEGVPGFMCDLSLIAERDGRLVTFLGYEGARLVQACEQLGELTNWRKYAIFGIPGYAPGWEINALANNIAPLHIHDFESVRYCGAAAVSSAYELLEDIFNESGAEDHPTIIAPLGTKPHGIATALFLIQHSRYQTSSLIYDHPERSRDRSREVRRWHLYRVTFDSS
jgi:hypothetical protein